jgi:multidrug efflux pump subunit AcrA (membrane-fusion protein)
MTMSDALEPEKTPPARRGVRRVLWLLGSLVLIGLLLWIGSIVLETRRTFNPESARRHGNGVAVKVAAAAVEDLSEVIGANAITEPTLSVDVKAEVSGRVKVVTVDVGKTVGPGDRLAEIDPMVYTAAFKFAQDNVVKTKSDLDKITQQSVTLREEWKAALAAAREGLARAQVELQNAEVATKRSKALYDQQVIAKAELEATEGRVAVAKAAQATAVQDLTKAQDQVANADVTIQALQDTAKSNYTKALEELTRAEQDLGNVVVKSPVAGVVMKRPAGPGQLVERIVSVGEFVSKGAVLLSLADLQSVMVVANVAEEKVGSVQLGQEAEVVFDSYRESVLTGRVEKIDPQTDPEKRTFKAYIRVQDPKLKLTPGLSAYARIKNPNRALAIPRLALVRNAGEASVFVVENSRARIRPIKVGAELAQKVEVLEGLKEGDQVVYFGLLGLKEDDLVNVLK